MSVVQGDAKDPTSLQARIRAAEAAVARRDAAFLREFDAMSTDVQEVGRKSLGWLAGGGAVAGVLLVIGALRPWVSGRHASAPRGRGSAHAAHAAPHHRGSGWLAAALPLVMSMLSQVRHVPPGAWRLPGMAGVVWSLLQRMRGGGASQGSATHGASDAGAASLHTVAALDLERYAGAWFEYARLPNTPEAICAAEVTAHYAAERDGTLRVLNRCIDRAGVMRDVRGVGRPGDAPGRLQVSFAPSMLHWLPFVWAPYWVIDIDPDYRHAVVGTPDRKHLWLLSRAPVIERATLQPMVEIAEGEGFDVDRLRRTPQRARRDVG